MLIIIAAMGATAVAAKAALFISKASVVALLIPSLYHADQAESRYLIFSCISRQNSENYRYFA